MEWDLIKFVTDTPGISTGYWKDKKTPKWALSSASNSERSLSSNKISPFVKF